MRYEKRSNSAAVPTAPLSSFGYHPQSQLGGVDTHEGQFNVPLLPRSIGGLNHVVEGDCFSGNHGITPQSFVLPYPDQIDGTHTPSRPSPSTGTIDRMRVMNTALTDDTRAPYPSAFHSCLAKDGSMRDRGMAFAREDNMVLLDNNDPAQDSEARLAAQVLINISLQQLHDRVFISQRWTELDWARIADPEAAMLTIWKRFGLTHANLGIRAFDGLRKEIWVIAMRLYFHLTPVELTRCAADIAYLSYEVSVLRKEYAPRLWGTYGDRSHQRADDALDAPVKDPMSDVDEHQGSLWLHFHQLIFLRAIAALRCYGDTMLMASTFAEHLTLKLSRISDTCIVHATPNAPALMIFKSAPPFALLHAMSLPREDLNMENFPFHKPPTMQPERPAKRQKTRSALSRSKRTVAAPAEFLTKYTSTCPLSVAFLDYLRLHDQSDIEEVSSLSNIETELVRFNESKAFSSGGHGASFSKVLLAWINFQHVVIKVKLEMAGGALAATTKSRLLTLLREAQASFVESSNRCWSAEEVMISVFQSLQMTMLDGRRMEGEMKKGFISLNEKFLALSDELGGGM